MEQLEELFKQMQELAGVGLDMLQGARGAAEGQGGGGAPKPPEGGGGGAPKPPEGPGGPGGPEGDGGDPRKGAPKPPPPGR